MKVLIGILAVLGIIVCIVLWWPVISVIISVLIVLMVIGAVFHLA